METSVIVREHNDPRVIEAMNLWWKEIDNGSRRDQLSLPYVLWNRELSVIIWLARYLHAIGSPVCLQKT